ncbi:MAG: hypothetical protein HY049_12955 [Acidobacteria bacterium]|nr:hypothetical protein [Acidobacteriota bacterium]
MLTIRTRSSRAAAVAALALAATLSAPRADVTIQETTKFDGFGESGMMGSEGTSVLVISGDKSRMEGTSKATGKFMKHFGGEEGFKSAQIFRLDRKVIYAVSYNDKSYQELPFDLFKQSQQAAADAMAQMQATQDGAKSGQAGPPPVTCDPVKFSAKTTGEKQAINGFDATHVVVTGDQQCHNTQDEKKTCHVVYTADYWQTPLTAPMKEARDYMIRQAAAMGIDPESAKQMAQAAKGLMSQFAEGLEGVGKELAKAQGYPVRSRLQIEKGGDCGLMDSGEGGEQGNPGAAMKQAFKGLFGKKKSDDSSDKPSGAAKGSEGAADGMKKVFGTTTEVTSITTSPAPADAFEPPAGFKKKDPPTLPKPAKG